MENLKVDRVKLGQSGEEAAVRYLKKKGFRIVERGFRLLRGEIDIIAYDRDTLVFVEVKTRSGTGFGVPEEAVTPSKQEQIRKIAQLYLMKKRLGDIPCRFDVVSILDDEPGEPIIRHIPDAF